MANPLLTNTGKPSLDQLQTDQSLWGADEIKVVERVAKVVVATGGTTAVTADIPVGAEIIDVTSICTRSNGGGTMRVRTGASSPVNITNALQCATENEVARAATIEHASRVVGADGVEVVANGNSDGGIVYIKYLKT